MSAPSLEFRAIFARFGERDVLRGVDLALSPHEHVLLVGASGSGKSTLLRLAAGLIAPAAGEVHLGGELASRAGRVLVRPERRGIGYLFQGGALWPHLTVAGNLRFVLAAAGVPRREHRTRIGELLEWVDLSGFDSRRPGTLSGGEAQRVALARALAARPPIVLLDEPLGPLDGGLRASLLQRLGELQARLGFAALHVTHDAAESAPIATRVLQLHDGRLAPAPGAS